MAFGGILNKAFQSVKLKKREYDPEAVSIDDIKLSSIYRKYDESRVNVEIKTELKAYKSLGYRFKKDKTDLIKPEYHSFQIGMILKAIELDLDLKVAKTNDYFHDNTLKLDRQTIVCLVADIIKKYDSDVRPNLSEIMLKKDLLFSPEDMGYLLYYLSFYQELEKPKNKI